MLDHDKVLHKQTADFIGRVVQNLPSLTSEEMQELIGNPRELQHRLAVLKTGLPVANLAHAHQVVTVNLDYDRPVSEGVESGNYNYANENITDENFPNQKSGKTSVDVLLFHRDQEEQSQRLIDEMDALGYRPANLAEELAIGEQHPDLQRKFPIIALGQTVRLGGNLRVPCLGHWYDRRGLSLDFFHVGWHRGCRFAFVRKNSDS